MLIGYWLLLFCQWDELFDQIQPISTRVPYMVCIGNIERYFPKSGYDESSCTNMYIHIFCETGIHFMKWKSG